MIEALIYATIAGLADYVRGGAWQPLFKRVGINDFRKPICMTITALVICSLFPFTWWSLLFVVWFGIVGWRAGTGSPMANAVTGHAYQKEKHGGLYEEEMEKWQFTPNAWWSLPLLGLIWTWPALGLAFIDLQWLYVPILYMFSFPFAAILGRKLFKVTDRWPAIEGMRSFIAMFFLSAGLWGI